MCRLGESSRAVGLLKCQLAKVGACSEAASASWGAFGRHVPVGCKVANSSWTACCGSAYFLVALVAAQVSAKELHALLTKPSLDGIPLLVLGNKNDLPGALNTQQLIDKTQLQVRICCFLLCVHHPLSDHNVSVAKWKDS